MNTTQHGVPVAVEYRNGTEWVDGRGLHGALEVGRDFTNWIKGRIDQYEFTEGEDYEVFAKSGENPSGGRPATEYSLSLDMAKELAMLENNEAGRRIRRYFIGVEKKARQLYTRMQELGIEQVEACAVMGYIYNRFSASPEWHPAKINKLFYLLSVQPPLTAPDIGKLLDVSDSNVKYWAKQFSRELYEQAAGYLSPVGFKKTIQLALPLEAEAAHA
jgi:phage anti-repressor protein